MYYEATIIHTSVRVQVKQVLLPHNYNDESLRIFSSIIIMYYYHYYYLVYALYTKHIMIVAKPYNV